MSAEFKIDFAWMRRDSGDPVDRCSLAGIAIEAGGVTVTAVEDSEARTTRREIHVSAFDLATWLVANWWRLRWEADGEGPSWSMSHKIGAAGNGYLWPDVEFISGGDTVRVRARPAALGSPCSLRFLNGADIHVPARDFEDGVRDFVEAVVSRVISLDSQRARDLSAAWRDLDMRIRDPRTSFGCAMEARMGLDPGELDPTVSGKLYEAADLAGRGALGELAAFSGGRVLEDFDVLWGDVRERSRAVSLDVSPGMRSAAREARRSNRQPWRQGGAVAEMARREWSYGNDPIRTGSLAELCGVSEDWITGSSNDEYAPIPAGFRACEREEPLRVALKKRHPTSRRFALARIIGDHLMTGEGECLLPVTDAHTDRQKYQRAFAQAFLCPLDALREYLGHRSPDDEFMEDAAEHFEVSPVLIGNALVNNGMLERDLVDS